MKKLITLLACFLVAVALMLSGCSTPNDIIPQEDTVLHDGIESQEEKILIEGRGSDSVNLDPTNATDNASWRVTRQIYENLVGFKPGSFDATPSLATSWETSEDQKTWTFTLRSGVKFHDGTDFNADAVVFNIERFWDKNNPYHIGKFPNVTSFFGGFKGDENCVIQDVKAIDENHLQITLNTVFPALLARLNDPTTGIISPTAIKKFGDEIGQNPVGTGPFAFQEWKTNDNITLVKNTNYWQSSLPKLDKLIFKVIPDNTSRLTALKSGEIDLMDGLNPSDAASVKNDNELQLIERPPINCGFFWINTERPPLDNVKVRQALNMAINKQGLIDAFYHGMAIPAKSILNPSSWAYNANMEGYQYNPDVAKQLLVEAGYPNGFTTDLYIRSETRPYLPQPQKIAQSMQADFANIGVKVNILPFEGATYAQKVYNADFTMASWGTGGNDPDPGVVLEHYFSKDFTTPPNAMNSAMYKSDKVTELLNKAQRIQDKSVRAELYQEAQQIIHDDAPILPIVHSRSLIASAAYVKNYVPFTDYYEIYINVDIER